MLKQQALLEITKGENVYQLHLPVGVACPLGEVHDVLHEMKQFVLDMIIKSNKPQQETPVETKTEGQNGEQYSQV
jgi:hypothetical protein